MSKGLSLTAELRKQWEIIKALLLTQNARIEELEAFAKEIAEWKLPETGETWNDGTPLSYTAKHGTTGVQKYFQEKAKEILTKKD